MMNFERSTTNAGFCTVPTHLHHPTSNIAVATFIASFADKIHSSRALENLPTSFLGNFALSQRLILVQAVDWQCPGEGSPATARKEMVAHLPLGTNTQRAKQKAL